MVRTAQNKIFIFREGEKVQIEAYGEHIIRVRASKGEIEDLNWTLLPPKEDRASVSEEGGQYCTGEWGNPCYCQ